MRKPIALLLLPLLALSACKGSCYNPDETTDRHFCQELALIQAAKTSTVHCYTSWGQSTCYSY